MFFKYFLYFKKRFLKIIFEKYFLKYKNYIFQNIYSENTFQNINLYFKKYFRDPKANSESIFFYFSSVMGAHQNEVQGRFCQPST